MTDQNFLALMWQKAEAMEREERELARVKQRDRALRRSALKASFLLILLTAALLLAAAFVPSAHLVLTLFPLPLLAAAVWQARADSDTIKDGTNT